MLRKLCIPLFVCAVLPLAQAAPTSQSIALLRWYSANLTAQFPAGNRPLLPAFDGAFVWIPNALDNTIIKLRAGDGANVGTFPTGHNPQYAAIDGASVWITNYDDNSVIKLRA